MGIHLFGAGVPVAVPGVRLAVGAAALHTDRCHSLASLDSATGGGRVAPQTRTSFEFDSHRQ